jgi:hypothetical protein
LQTLKTAGVKGCRLHKIRNICDQLPDDLPAQVKSAMQAVYGLPWQESMARPKKQADWLGTLDPGAAGRIREGLEVTFSFNRVELSAALQRCLGTTTIWAPPLSLKTPKQG